MIYSDTREDSTSSLLAISDIRIEITRRESDGRTSTQQNSTRTSRSVHEIVGEYRVFYQNIRSCIDDKPEKHKVRLVIQEVMDRLSEE